MRRSALYPFLGPALVLYLLADVSAAQGDVDFRGYVIAALSLLLSSSLLVRVSDADGGEFRRVGFLGFAVSLSLVRLVVGATLDFAVEAASAIGLCAVTALSLDLALTVPDSVVAARHVRAASLYAYALCAAAAALSILALGPALSWFGTLWLLPAVYAHLASGCFAVGVTLALALRLSRKHLGSSPEALASNVWATLGLAPAVITSALVAGRRLLPELVPQVDLRVVAPGVALCMVVGHLWLVDPTRRLAAGSTIRELAVAAVSGALLGVFLVPLRGYFPHSPAALGLAIMATWLLGLVLLHALRPPLQRALSPFGGRLLTELRAFPEATSRIHGLLGLARIELAAMRRASGASDTEPLLYTLDPAFELRIDAAGETHEGDRPLHPAILEQFRTAPGELIVRAPLEAKIVRQPKLRPLVQVLQELDALCVVPLCYEGEIEGAIVIPRGARRAALTLEELQALLDHARFVASLLAMFCAHARAEARAHALIVGRDRAEASVERLEDALAQSRADLELLSSGRSSREEHAELIAYSPAMRTLLQRLRSLAGHDVPVLLQAESGLEVDGIARFLHLESGRSAQPLLTVDCAALRAQDASAALFGGDTGTQRHPGALRLAAAGTLLLIDVAALPLDVQRQLAAALASRSARTQDGRESYTVMARVIATCQTDLELLAPTGDGQEPPFDPELHSRLAPCTLRVPPLRERPDDVESLALLALDRASRRQGRAALGLAPDAIDALRAYAFPGNVAELESVLQRAVSACRGTRIVESDLPLGEPASALPDVLAGTLEDVERRALEHALARALGNKSEAARLLGLPRTTFLDKLRRHKLDDGTRDSQLPPN